MKSEASFPDIASGRARKLQTSAYTLRQHAIDAGSDLEGWRLSRRMRDAASLREVNAVERELGHYLRTHEVTLSHVA